MKMINRENIGPIMITLQLTWFVFLFLKVVGIISWSWWVVFLPLAIGLLIYIVFGPFDDRDY